MVGRDLGDVHALVARSAAFSQRRSVVLSVKNLKAPGLEDVSFEVRAGEILGIGGLPDSGKDGLGEALFGLRERKGAVSVDGAPLRAADPLACDPHAACPSCRPIGAARAACCR